VICNVVVQADLPQGWVVPAAPLRKHVAFLFYLRRAVDIILHAGSYTHASRPTRYIGLCRGAATALILNYSELLGGLLELAERLYGVVELVMT